MRDLSQDELRRYSRHLLLPEVGPAGQQRLAASSVLLIGAGGLGSPAALYLAAAGVGHIGIADFDRVDESNLQRQVLHGTDDIGTPKTASAARRLHALNPLVTVTPHEGRLSAANARAWIEPYDLVIDGSDNFTTRYLANDACVLLGKPLVYGSVFRFDGQASVFDAKRGPCYRCLFPEPPPPELAPNCAEAGVLGVLPGLIGMIQATEALKLLLGIGDSLVGRLLLVDARRMTFREMHVPKDPECPVCGRNPTIRSLREESTACATPSPQGNTMNALTVTDLKAALDRKEKLVLLDVREPVEWNLCRLPNAVHIPLGTLPARMDELDRNADIVVYCRSGGRSAKAVEFLAQNGFRKVRNLTGGTLAWSDHVDPSMPKY